MQEPAQDLPIFLGEEFPQFLEIGIDAVLVHVPQARPQETEKADRIVVMAWVASDHDRVDGHRRAVCTKVKIQTVSARTS